MSPPVCQNRNSHNFLYASFFPGGKNGPPNCSVKRSFGSREGIAWGWGTARLHVWSKLKNVQVNVPFAKDKKLKFDFRYQVQKYNLPNFQGADE